MDRPTGVTILAILAWLFAILWIGLGLVLLAGGSAAMIFATPLGALGVAGGIILVIIGLIDAAAGYGLWNLRPWGWTLAVVLIGINILQGLIGVAFGDWVGSLLSLLVNGFIMWYLFRPHVKAAFSHRYRDTAYPRRVA